MELTYSVQLDSGAKYIARGEDSLSLKTNDMCIIRKDFYLDYGKIVQIKGEFNPETFKEELPKIQRKADFHDKSKAHENIMRAKSAFRTTDKFVEQLKLPMKLLNAHYTFDKKLITIQFTAEGRVDFRELVKQLTQTLNTRVELRQIGVRDETAICGGLGVCGQELCCSRFLKGFASINVKMAKDQDLSLNPSSISGICGRLKCCLKYEHEGYKELEKAMPKRGEMCDTPDGRGRIIDRNLLSKMVTVRFESKGQDSFHVDELTLGKDMKQAPKKSETYQERTRPNKGQKPREGQNKSKGQKPREGQNKPKGQKPKNAQNKPKGQKNQNESGDEQKNQNKGKKKQNQGGQKFSQKNRRPNRNNGPKNKSGEDKTVKTQQPQK